MFYTHKYLTVGSRLKISIFSHYLLFTTFKSSSHGTLHNLLEKCCSMRELKLLHAQIITNGLSSETLTLGRLISFCAVADSGDLQYAQFVFDRIREPNKFMYNSLIRGYSKSHDESGKAILLYRRMIGSGYFPNEFTLPFVIKACASRLEYWVAVVVHCQGIKLGFGSQVFVQNALINVYVVCGLLQCARKVFDDIPERTLVSWNSMIGGYSSMGCCEAAVLLFGEMKESGVEPDEFTLVILLSLCSQTCDIDLGRYVHFYVEINGFSSDVIVRNALLDMYAKCGDLHSAETIFKQMADKNVISWTSLVTAYAKQGLLESAEQIFDQMPVKNVVSWNSMISSYVREGRCRNALTLFYKMCSSGVVPDEATFVSIFSACSQIGNLVMGKKTHSYIRSNNITPSVTLCNSIVDMYAKCGAIGIAMSTFFEMPEKDLVSWNVIIGGLALNGCGLEAIKLFEKMQDCGISPDAITFTGLLSACCHSGLVDMGQYYFTRMFPIYRVSHDIEHYACMVDLLGRGGFLDEAIRLIGGMPMKPDVVIWGALLGACRTHGRSVVDKQILKQLLELAPYSSGLYVLLANIYCEAQRWEEMKKIRKLMNDSGIKKCKAISFIEIDGHVHEFMVDDKRHDISSSMYAMLDRSTSHLKSVGYLCNVSYAFLDVEEI